jgi:hypothetical protein
VAAQFEAVTRRLAYLGTEPLDPAVAVRTRARFHRVRPSSGRRISRLTLLVAATIAFVLASVGLAAADTLPDPVQEVAHNALAKVGLHVPPGHDRYNDPAVCPGGPYKNHGEYVRSHKDDPDAGASPCGKPVKSTTHADDETNDDANAGDGDGPPPGAHGNGHGHKTGKKADKENGEDDEAKHDRGPVDSTDRTEAPTTTSAPTPTAPSSTTAPDETTTTAPAPTSTTTTSNPS